MSSNQRQAYTRSHERALLLAGCVVCALGLAAELWHGLSGDHRYDDVVFIFSLSYEQNLPTWYSSILLVASAWSLVQRAGTASKHRRYWLAMAAGLLLASLDEFMELHERLGGLIGTSGVLYFDWIIPASVVMTILVILFVPFVRGLSPATRKRFIVAGVIFLGGALMMEMPLGYWTERHGADNLGYALIDWVEESLEILGASLFLLAVLKDEERP